MQKSEFIKQRPYFFTGIAGLVVIVIALWIQLVFPKESAHMASGFSTPIIYFEFIQSPDEVNAFFGVENGRTNELFVKQMDRGNYADFAFMLAYSAFLFLFFRKLSAISELTWFKTGMILAVLALVGDLIENIQLLGITANLENGDFITQLLLLKLFTWIKWGSLAISFALFSFWLVKFKGFYRIIGYIVATPFIMGIIAIFNRGMATELFAKSVSIVFFVMICYCFFYQIPIQKTSEY
jgi:hypothetical protein